MLSVEDKFIVNLILNKRTSISNLNEINLESLIKISSRHLIIPLIHYKIRENKYILDCEFIKYTKKIFELNKQRNTNIENQIIELEKILKKNKIRHVFIKGAKYIKNKIYDDIGVRMLGDIDFLFEKKNKELLLHILKENNYFNKFNFKYFESRHIPRFINKNRICAVEPHIELLLHGMRKYTKPYDYLNPSLQKIKEKDAELSILNYQINDYGHLYCTYNYRTIYDVIILTENFDITMNFKNKYIKRFIIICAILGVYNKKIKLSIWDKIYILRFRTKFKYKLFRIIDNTICKIILIFQFKRILQLIEFIFNKNYRRFILKTYL